MMMVGNIVNALQMTVCAIVPTYNRADYISECLDSLLNQSYAVEQIIVVDDGSTDDTQAVLKKYRGRIRCIKKENGGKSSALNLALPEVTSDLVWICDDDDVADKEAVKNLVAPFVAHPETGFTFGKFQLFSEDKEGKRQIWAPPRWRRAEEATLKISIMESMFIPQFSMLVKKSVYDDVGEFNTSLIRSQDYDMLLRLSRYHAGFEIDDVIFYQRKHSGMRGNATNQVAASNVRQKWLEYDKVIFEDIDNTYEIAEFTPEYASSYDSDAASRAAYLQKAVIFAKRGLWFTVCQALEEAVTVSTVPIDENEIALLEFSVKDIEPWLELYQDKSAMKALSDIRQKSYNGGTGH